MKRYIDKIEDQLVDDDDEIAHVIHAHWNEQEINQSMSVFGCSNCKRVAFLDFKYCPNCGAKMDECMNLPRWVTR